MNVTLFLELAIKSAAVPGITLLLLHFLKGRSAAQSSWVAHAGLLALLLLPLSVLMPAAWRLSILSEPDPTDAATRAPLQHILAGQTPVSGSIKLPLFEPQFLLLATYAVGAGILLVVTVVAVVRLFALQARSAVVVEANWLTALARAQHRIGVKYGAALLVSDEITSPISWGLMRPTILLNKDVVSLHGDAEAIIAHELAHVVRLDWIKLIAARVVTALYWFNPLVWVLARQCHQLREEAADDAVLRSDIQGTDYAALLVGVARHECKASVLAAHGVAPGRNSLRQRITRVLDQGRSRLPAATPWAMGCLAGTLLLAGTLSTLTFERPATAKGVLATRPEPGPFGVAMVRKEPAELRSAPAPLADASRTKTAGQPPKVKKEERKTQPSSQQLPATGTTLDPMAPDFGERIANITSGNAGSKVRLPPERDFADAGYADLHPRQKTVLTSLGVSPAYMRDLRSVGYSNLSVDDLVMLRQAGVSAEFIRKVQPPGERQLTPDELVDLRHR